MGFDSFALAFARKAPSSTRAGWRLGPTQHMVLEHSYQHVSRSVSQDRDEEWSCAVRVGVLCVLGLQITAWKPSLSCELQTLQNEGSVAAWVLIPALLNHLENTWRQERSIKHLSTKNIPEQNASSTCISHATYAILKFYTVSFENKETWVYLPPSASRIHTTHSSSAHILVKSLMVTYRKL